MYKYVYAKQLEINNILLLERLYASHVLKSSYCSVNKGVVSRNKS